MEELYQKIMNYVPENEQEINDKRIMLKYLKKFEDIFTRENEMFHFTTSAWIVNPDRTKVLMIYHNIYDSWAWVGGHADGNSNLLEVVQKEITEETGLTKVKLLHNGIFGLSIQTVKAHHKRGKYVSPHLHYDIQFLFEKDDTTKLQIKPDENSNVKWIDKETILEQVTEEHMKPLYDKLIHKVDRLYPYMGK